MGLSFDIDNDRFDIIFDIEGQALLVSTALQEP
jgi:hypothetical protein